MLGYGNPIITTHLRGDGNIQKGHNYTVKRFYIPSQIIGEVYSFAHLTTDYAH